MPVESAADLASMFNPEEFGDSIVYQPPSGAPIGAVAIWNRPGGFGRLSNTEVASDDHLFLVPRSEVAAPANGGHIEVVASGERFLIIREPEAPDGGAVWHISAAPAA